MPGEFKSESGGYLNGIALPRIFDVHNFYRKITGA